MNKRYLLALLLIATLIASFCLPAMAADDEKAPVSIVPIEKQPTDAEVLKVLQRAGIDKQYVEIINDYGLKSDNCSPYSKTYKDRKSELYITVIAQTPMVDANGDEIIVGWNREGESYTSKNNLFDATVLGDTITITCVNDQPTGIKKGDSVTYSPQLFIGGKELIPSSPILRWLDPVNSNYTDNNLQWNYGNVVRNLRLIEGSVLGTWTFLTNPKADVLITYNPTGKMPLYLGQYSNGKGEEYIPQSVFDSPLTQYPFTITDSTTFYPDADPETTSVDGYVIAGTLPQTDWTNVVNAEGGGEGSTSAGNVIIYAGAGTSTDKWIDCGRAIYLFDTSSLADNATILGATLSIYGYDKFDHPSAEPNINVVSSNPASDNALIGADYSTVGSTEFSDNITYAGWNTAGYNDFILNATGYATVSTDNVTKLAVRNTNYDLIDQTPPWITSTSWWLKGYFAEQGEGFKPKLVVTWFVAAVPTVTNAPASDISETTAVLSGNITSTNGSNATVRGFEWDTDTGAPYANEWHEDGDYGTGVFNHTATGLPPDTTIYWRAYATNVIGTGYSDERSFDTLLPLPLKPDNLTITKTGVNSISVTWDLGLYADNVTFRIQEDSSPTSMTDGYALYSGNLTSANATGLSLGISTYYISGWCSNETGDSVDYAQDSIGGENMVWLFIIGLAALLTLVSVRARQPYWGFMAAIVWIFFLVYTRDNPIPGVTVGSVADNFLLLLFMGMAMGVVIMSFRSWSRERALTNRGFAVSDTGNIAGSEKEANELSPEEEYRQKVRKALHPKRRR